jgi:hypothetical protein
MASEPAYLIAFREFNKAGPTLADLEELEKEAYGQSARACGILLASVVELSLKKAIRSLMRKGMGSSLDKKLFGLDGPLGRFQAKIELGYAFDLFGPKTYHDLGLIRLMRNQFAHSRVPLRFDTPVVHDVCKHLQLADFNEVYVSRTATTGETFTDKSNPRVRFIVTCHTISFHLSGGSLVFKTGKLP